MFGQKVLDFELLLIYTISKANRSHIYIRGGFFMYNRYGYSGAGASVLGVLLVLVALAVGILYLIAWCKMFHKAGLPWERLFVPVYGQYWMYKFADAAGIFWGILAGSVLYPIISMLILSGRNYEAIGVIGFIYLLFMLAMVILYSVKLARAFGKGGGFAVGLVLLNPIFIMILGFGDAQYVLGRSAYNSIPTGWRCPTCNTINNSQTMQCTTCGYMKF